MIENFSASVPADVAVVAPKKTRRPGTRWVRFGSLAPNEMFLVGKVRMFKRSTFVAEEFDKPTADTLRIWPWTKVHSLRPVKGGTK